MRSITRLTSLEALHRTYTEAGTVHQNHWPPHIKFTCTSLVTYMKRFILVFPEVIALLRQQRATTCKRRHAASLCIIIKRIYFFFLNFFFLFIKRIFKHGQLLQTSLNNGEITVKWPTKKKKGKCTLGLIAWQVLVLNRLQVQVIQRSKEKSFNNGKQRARLNI